MKYTPELCIYLSVDVEDTLTVGIKAVLGAESLQRRDLCVVWSECFESRED